MLFFGKKKTEESGTLKTYLASLLTLCLCCAMFLSTTFAWFSSNVSNTANQIQTGSLHMDMQIHNGTQWVSVAASGAPKVFTTDPADLWVPGDYQIQKLRIVNSSTIPAEYALKIAANPSMTKTPEELNAIASCFSVYTLVDGMTYDPANVQLLDTTTWTLAGSLADILQGKPVVSDQLDALSGGNSYTKDITLALMLNSATAADAAIMGNTLSLDISMIANQQVTDVTQSGVLTVKEGSDTVLKGNCSPMIVNGKGKLVLKDVTVVAGNEGQHALEIAPGADVTLVIEGQTALTGAKNGSAIYVSEDANLTVTGDTLVAVGNAGAEYEPSGNYSSTTDTTFTGGGSGIGGKGVITIDGLHYLSAKGYGKGGFGIGGNGAEVTIKNSVVNSARGGYINVTGNLNDSKYTKSEPEGGAAIGGAKIVLEDSTIKEAIGGSKAAGIGAAFWQPVQISITNCEIQNVVGGVSAAGIGGARLRGDDPKNQTTTIAIHNSTVKAEGGYFAAGIGSGYSADCLAPDLDPVCTINITGNSHITAQGGKYGAGIGTGYHNAGLAGKIESSVTVNATGGGNREKYTIAMDVGFGVIDMTREGNGNTCTFDYQGTILSVSSATPVA